MNINKIIIYLNKKNYILECRHHRIFNIIFVVSCLIKNEIRTFEDKIN